MRQTTAIRSAPVMQTSQMTVIRTETSLGGLEGSAFTQGGSSASELVKLSVLFAFTNERVNSGSVLAFICFPSLIVVCRSLHSIHQSEAFWGTQAAVHGLRWATNRIFCGDAAPLKHSLIA